MQTGWLKGETSYPWYLNTNKIDIMLVTETHFTSKNYFNLHECNFYDTQHPDGTAHGGTAVIIRKNIKHHELLKYEKEHLQATSIQVEEWSGPLVLSAVYCPPKHRIKSEEFNKYFKTLGPRFIAGRDYNAKNKQWGSRLNTARGNELQRAMTTKTLENISTRQPAYWPTDPNKIPDLLDFFIAKGIVGTNTHVEPSLELSSDHTPIILTISTGLIHTIKAPYLHNKNTNWEQFQTAIGKSINLLIPLKTEIDIDDATEKLTRLIQTAAWESTPKSDTEKKTINYPLTIKNKITKKRRLRRKWQISQNPTDKNKYNKAIKELKKLIRTYNNDNLREKLANLTATQATDYSLWKMIRNLKQPQTQIPPIRIAPNRWARSEMEKANAFAEHLSEVFTPITYSSMSKRKRDPNVFKLATTAKSSN